MQTTMDKENIGSQEPDLFDCSSFNDTQSTEDTSLELRESVPWVRKYFRVIVSDDGTKRRACGAVGCSKTYQISASHKVLRGHIMKEHKNKEFMTTFTFSNDPVIDAIYKFVILERLPYSIVESQGFRYLLHKCAPIKSFPTRQEISNGINAKRGDIQQMIKEQLKSVQSIGLTFDIWSTRGRTHGYGCVVAHFVDSNHRLRAVPLEFAHIPYPHNGPTICDFLTDIIVSYGIQKKVVGITTDNASENPAAVAMLRQNLELDKNFSTGFLYFRCVAHVINLAVKESLKSLKGQVSDIRKIVYTIRNSTKRSEMFELIQKELLPDHGDSKWKGVLRLVEDVDTRWNSVYSMLERAYVLRKAIDKAIDSIKDLRDLEIQEIDWLLIEDLLKFLDPFKEITEQLSGQKYATISMVNAYMPKLRSHLDQSFTNECITSAAKAFKHKLEEYNDHLDQPAAILATVLDPRFKMSPIPQEARPFVSDLLSRKLESYQEESSSLSQRSCESYFHDVYAEAETDEVKSYLDSLREPQQCNIVNYWQLNQPRFPKLYKLAMTLLPLQATSVSCERTFSAAGLVDTPRRNRLSTESLGSNMCIGFWLKHLDLI